MIREHDEAATRADDEALARFDRVERELDDVQDERRALRDLAQGGSLYMAEGYVEWRERATAAIDAWQRAELREGDREQRRSFTETLRLKEAFKFDDEVAALISDWTAFEIEARARGMEALDLVTDDPLLTRIRHLAGHPPEGETPPQALAGILAGHQARTAAREKSIATIATALEAYRACHEPQETEMARPLSGIRTWCRETAAAIETWRAMTEPTGRDSALSAAATVLDNLVAFEERAQDVADRLQSARGDDGTANPFLEAKGEVLAADLRALTADPPRHAIMLVSLRQALDELDSHQSRVVEWERAAARIERALEDYRACHAPMRDTVNQLSTIRHWCREMQRVLDIWRELTDLNQSDPLLTDKAAVLEHIIAFERRAFDVALRWLGARRTDRKTNPFLGAEGDALAAELRALEAALPLHAMMPHDLQSALERLGEHERAVAQTRELLERAIAVDEGRRSLLESEGRKSRSLNRRFNQAWKRWRDAAEAVAADIDAADGTLIAHLDDAGVASRVRAEWAANGRLDHLPGWLLLRLHDNAVEAGSAIHPAMTEGYRGIISDMQRLDASLRENDSRRVALRGEINQYHRLMATRRKVARLLGELQTHVAEAVFIGAWARREELPVQQSMAWARWHSRSLRLEDEAFAVLASGGDQGRVLQDGEGTRQAIEAAIVRFEQTRAAYGEPENGAHLERARREDQERGCS